MQIGDVIVATGRTCRLNHGASHGTPPRHWSHADHSSLTLRSLHAPASILWNCVTTRLRQSGHAWFTASEGPGDSHWALKALKSVNRCVHEPAHMIICTTASLKTQLHCLLRSVKRVGVWVTGESESDKGQGHFKSIHTFKNTWKGFSSIDSLNLFFVSLCW